jgi:thiosulfate dehydrogenase [quinone] large subunit
MNTRSLSTATMALGAAATVLLLFLIFPPLADATEGLRTVFTWAFWIVAIALLVVIFLERRSSPEPAVEIQGPAFARFLFSDRRAGYFWLPIRLFLGIQWLEAGLHKFEDPAWMSGGSALRGFWERAVAIPDGGRPLITFEWYRDFLNWLLSINAESWFAQAITIGEMAVGLGLIVGCLTGVAAFFGATMNMSFLLAGSASTNPIMFAMAIGLILAWKVAGYVGVDRWLLPRLGTPWDPRVVAPHRPVVEGA